MYTGITGALKIANKLGIYSTIAHISGWSIEDNTEIISKTELGCDDKKAFAGYQSWSASADGAVVFNSAGTHETLITAKQLGTKVAIRFYLLDSELDNKNEKSTYFCGEGYIESISVNLSAEDKGNISISIVGDGPLALYVDDRNVITQATERKNEYLRMRIKDDGNLYLTVSDDFEGTARVDDDGYLVLML